ncbi:hypothetical protein LguiB_008648 [Lonicera macranthoides]
MADIPIEVLVICKTWNHVLCDPEFNKRHLNQQIRIFSSQVLEDIQLLRAIINNAFSMYVDYKAKAGTSGGAGAVVRDVGLGTGVCSSGAVHTVNARAVDSDTGQKPMHRVRQLSD